MKKLLLSVFSLAALAVGNNAQAQTPTWSDDVARILYTNCTSCHHEGGAGPMSLMTYTEASNYKFQIGSAINDNSMPPWPPDVNYRHFAGERKLSAGDLAKLNDWIANGAPEGTGTAPTPPVYVNGSQLPSVSKSLKAATFTVPTITSDLYQCFVIPTGLTQNEYITALEVIPGNPSIVHHVLIYEDTTSTHKARAMDDASPEPGYTNFGGPGVDGAALVGGWVPGTRPGIYPAGMGVLLHKNADLIVQIHYPAGSTGKTDSTKINLRLSTGALRQVTLVPPLNHITSITSPLSIPANTVKTFTEKFTVPANIPIQGISLLNVAPHAHLLCQNWLVFAVTPLGDTIPLIKIDKWDFHWQGFYTFQKLQFIPKGTTLWAKATYDNTSNNPHNPSSPPKNVTVGEATTDEMMLVYISYLLYNQGDENVILDSTLLNTPTDIEPINDPDGFLTTAQLYDAIPNPAKGETTISYFLPQSGAVALKVYDLSGKLVDEISATNAVGLNQVKYNTGNLSPGNYMYSLSAGGVIRTKQLVITE